MTAFFPLMSKKGVETEWMDIQWRRTFANEVEKGVV